MTVVIGTAGHIDHGKTTLLRALTGIDADRLPEERARGMTIDVGYAHLAPPDGGELDFVDVPGHDRLVGNMLVGAGEIDAALLVIAADDGPRAQTREHLELLDALGIDDGLIVITKSDAVSRERVAEVIALARALVAPTSLRDAPIRSVAATTGAGLDDVRVALLELRDRMAGRGTGRGAGRTPDGDTDAGCRLAIDRVFTIRGRGTVVTGTLRGDGIARGAVLRAVPDRDERSIRVREVQVHGRTVNLAGPGRVALNVAGEGVAVLERGIVLTNDPEVVASDRWLVALRPARPARGERRGPGALPADRTAVSVHVGTAHASGVVGRSGRDAVDLEGDEGDEGDEGSAVLRLDRPVAIRPGDRFVLRRPSPGATLAGGRILDPMPARGVARRRSTPDRLAALGAARAGSEAWRTARLELHGALAGSPPTMAPDVADSIDDALLAEVEHRPGQRMAELHRAGVRALRRAVGTLPARGVSGDDPAARIVDARLESLVGAGRLTRNADLVWLAGFVSTGPSPALAGAMDRLVAAISTVSPPPLGAAARAAGCPPEGIRLLEQANRIVRLDDDLAWAFPTYRDLAARALALSARAPLTPAALRDDTGTSRKYVMAILEDLDRRAILRRTPDGHVPGPRAPQPASGPDSERGEGSGR